MDQQSFEATRPVSADPAVALAEALGQLPKENAKAKGPVKTSIEDLAGELGLTLGDQTGLSIRRVKRGKGYSFHRANAPRAVCRPSPLHPFGAPSYRDVRYSAIRVRTCRPSASGCGGGCSPASRRWKRSASSARRSLRGCGRPAEDPPQVSAYCPSTNRPRFALSA